MRIKTNDCQPANKWLIATLLMMLSVVALPSVAEELKLNSATTRTGDAPDEELLALLKQSVNDAGSFEDRYDAEVWLLAKSGPLERFITDKQERLNFLKKVHYEAIRAGLQPEIVLAVIEIESRFDPYAVSYAGAQGIMQVMPFWKDEIGRPDDSLINTDTNLRYGCTILKYYLDKENGKIADALARYNGSYGSYGYTEKVLDAWVMYWR